MAAIGSLETRRSVALGREGRSAGGENLGDGGARESMFRGHVRNIIKRAFRTTSEKGRRRAVPKQADNSGGERKLARTSERSSGDMR